MAGTEKKMSGSYDAVIVGAGNGGLCAALALAMKGAKPLLLEQHNLPGGFATSFVRGRFEFEASLHELSEVGPPENPGNVRKFFDEAGIDMEWMRVPEAYRVILPDDGINVRVPFGVDAFIDTIADAVPGSRETVEKYMRHCRDTVDVLNFLGKMAGNTDPGKIVETLTAMAREAEKPVRDAADFLRKAVNFIKDLGRTVDDVTLPFGMPHDAVSIIYPYWCYLGIPMSRLAFPIWAGMLLNYLDNGAYIPKMRSHEMVSAIEKKILEFGGRIEYNTRVEKILVEKGKVTGVETARGDRFSTGQVICNASPTLAYNKLVHPHSEAPKMALKTVNMRRHGGAGFVVYLGLDAPIEKIGIADYGYFISEGMDTDRIYASMERMGVPDMQATTCLNAAIPDASPEGTTILSMTTLFTPEVWEGVKPAEYFKLKNEIAGGMIDQFERATGMELRSRIEEIEVATPQTFARYTRAYKGSIYAYEQDVWDYVIPRIIASKDEKYIEGLEFVGGYAETGSGYSPSLMSGKAAGLAVAAALGA